MPNSCERLTIQILQEKDFGAAWDRKIKDAHASRGTLRHPVIIPLPRGNVLVAQNVPGLSTEIDLDPDVMR